LDDATRRAIQQDCETVEIAMMRAVDLRQYDQAADFFTSSAVLDVGTPLIGKDAIRAWLVDRPSELRSRHVLTNVLVEVIDADRARVTSLLTLYRDLGESRAGEPSPLASPAAVGDYSSELVRIADGWRIQTRKLDMAFRRSDF